MFVFSLLFVLSSKAAASLHPTTSPLQNNTFICGVTRNFTAANGYIKSPGYPVRYPSSTFCTYDIHVGWGLRIELTWKDFDIDGDMPECSSANCDYVEAFTGYVIKYIHCISDFLTVNRTLEKRQTGS